MKLKEKFDSIDQSKLNADQKDFLSKIEKATKNFTSDNKEVNDKVEGALDKMIATFKEKMPEAIKTKAEKKEPKTSAKKSSETNNPKRTVMSVAKEIRKDGESWADAQKRARAEMKKDKDSATKEVKTEMDKLLAFIKTRKELEGISGTDLKRDSSREAKPRGRRISKDGNVYYENRENRIDRLAPNYPKYAPMLAKGGMLSPKERYNLEIKGLTGVSVGAIEKYIDENNLNDNDVLNIVVGLGRKQLKGADVSTAMVGKKGNAESKKLIEFVKDNKAMKLELGGNVGGYDLAGHLDGTFNVGQNDGALSGVSGTSYSGLVGETGAMSSGEMFEDGGDLSGFTGTQYSGLVGETGAMSSGEMFAEGGYLTDPTFGQFQAGVYAKGGSLANHGIKEGDTFIKTIAGNIQKVKDKDGKIVFINLANGERDSQPPLPFDDGGEVTYFVNKDGIKVRSVAKPDKELSEKEWMEKHSESKEARAYAGGGKVEHYDLDKEKLNKDAQWYADRIISGNSSTSKESLINDIEEYNKDLYLLEIGRIKPAKVIGTGYKGNTRKMANTWLLERIYVNKKILELLNGKIFADGGEINAFSMRMVKGTNAKPDEVLTENQEVKFAKGGSLREKRNDYLSKLGDKEADVWDKIGANSGTKIRGDKKMLKAYAEGVEEMLIEENVQGRSFDQEDYDFYTDQNWHLFNDFLVWNGYYKPEMTVVEKKWREKAFKEGNIYVSDPEVIFVKRLSSYDKKGYVQVVKTASRKYVVELKTNAGDWKQFNDTWNLDELEKAEKFAKRIAENNKVKYEGVDTTPYEAIHGKSKNYIVHADIKSVTVNQKGMKYTFKGSDVLNGANILEKGNVLETKAIYIPKRDVISIELKDGSEVKPSNGYWIKKDASGELFKPKSEKAESKFEVGDFVYNKRTKTIGVVRDVFDKGEVRTDADGVVNVSEITIYKEGNATHRKAKIAPSTQKELEKSVFKDGGKVSFAEKSKAIAKNFEGKRVEPEYQKEYGKTYDAKEAKEVGDKIAGAQKAKYDDKAEKGAVVKKKVGNPNAGSAMILAKKIRKDGEKWTDALKRANAMIKKK